MANIVYNNEEIILKSPFEDIVIPDISVGEYIYNKLKSHNDKVVLIESKSDKSLTAGQLSDESQSVAQSLLNYGITKNDTILFFSLNTLEYAITQIAITYLGITFSTAKPYNRVFEVTNQINDCGATIVFTSVDNAKIVKEVTLNNSQIKHVFVLDGEYENFIPFENLIKNEGNKKLSKIPVFPVNADDASAILYSSGTTGLPKGAVYSNYNYLAMIMIAFESHKFSDAHTTMSCHLPFAHASAVSLFPSYICSGQTIVVQYGLDFDKILASIEKYRINQLPISGAFGEYLLTSVTDKYDLSSVTDVFATGVRFPEYKAKKISEKLGIKMIRENFGMTEIAWCTYKNANNPVYIPSNIAPFAPNIQLKIIDKISGKSLGPNEIGEMYLKGPIVMKGYLNNPIATAENIDPNGWLRTGDMCYFNELGHIIVVDRMKEMIKYRGTTVWPAEIEMVLKNHNAISEAAVFGIPNESDDERPRAYVVLKDGFTVTKEEIQKYVADRMAPHKQLRGGVVIIEKMPLTIIGKVDRQYFKKLINDEFSNK